jgi:protein-disulfide isomerase
MTERGGKELWKPALIGGAAGAGLATILVFGAAVLGLFPSPRDRQFESYLMSHPSIILAMAEKAQRDQAQSEERALQSAVDKIGLSTYFDPKLAFVTGPANAKNSLVEFFDYNCVHCRNSYPVVKKFYDAHRADTRFAFVEFPIFGKDSEKAARAALAARRQPDKYVAFHFALMGQDGEIGASQIADAGRKAGLDLDRLKSDMSDPALDRQIAVAHALATRTGITGTPFFIVNGKAHEGEIDEAFLKKMTGA